MNTDGDLIMGMRRSRFFLVLMCVLLGLWIAFAKLVVPQVIESAYRGESLPLLNSIIEGRATHPVDKYLREWEQLATHITVASMGFGLLGLVLFMVTSSPAFFRRCVGEATPGTLGAIRMLICAILLVATLMEDFPSIALLPVEMRVPKGVMGLFYTLPIGFDRLVSSETGLRVFQLLTELILFLGMIGWRTRIIIPLGALCHLVLWGILRDYTFFWHQTLIPFYVMVVLSFAPCGDGWSVDRLWKVLKGQAVPAADQGSPVYGWARYACWVAIAALYVESGTSKLRIGGLDWWNATNIKNIFFTESLLPREFDWAVALHLTPAPDLLFAMLGLTILVGQVLFGLVLFSRTARLIFPAAMVASHIGILVLQRILFFDLILIHLVFYDFTKIRRAIARWLAIRRGGIEILYDGLCPLCRRTVRLLAFFDLFARFEFLDFRRLDLADYNYRHQLALTVDELDKEMYIISRGRADRGFYGYRTIALVLPAFWLVAPLLFLPGVPTVGQLIYGYVARNRLSLVKCDSNCDTSSYGINSAVPRPDNEMLRSHRYTLLVSVMTVVLAFFWFYGIEFYPFTSTQLFSNQRKTSVVSYYKVLAHWESGLVSTAHLEDSIAAMKRNSRYELLMQHFAARLTTTNLLPRLYPDDSTIFEACRKFLEASAAVYNRRAPPGHKITAYEIQVWNWDFQTHPFDPNHGTAIARYVFDVERSVPTGTVRAHENSMSSVISTKTPQLAPVIEAH